MALLPSGALDTVVAFGLRNSDNQINFTATGFLFGEPVEGKDNDVYPCLITNRHVVQGCIDSGARVLQVRFNKVGSLDSKIYQIPTHAKDGRELWTFHEDASCDVAAMLLPPNQFEQGGLRYEFCRGGTGHVIYKDLVHNRQIGEGDGVFVLGFPMGQAGEERNYPIVRQGAIARIQDWADGTSRSVLIDANVFPGNSGGPVFIKPELASFTGTPNNPRALLLGMISAYIPYIDRAISEQTGTVRSFHQENSGLAKVVPFDVIKETVNVLLRRVLPTGSVGTSP